MVDHAMHFLEAAALETMMEEEVGEVLYMRFFERFGPITVLLSDRGKQLRNLRPSPCFG